MRTSVSRLKQVLGQAVGAFGVPGFGPYFGGQAATAAGFNMVDIGRAWLVYSLTDSAMALGWLRTGWSVASLIVPLVGGMVADRFKRRTVMIVGTVLVTLPTLIVWWLIVEGVLRWWYLPISLLLESTLFGFIVPARQAYLSTLVEPEVLMNATSLDFVAMAIPALLFSVAGGALVDRIGATSVFLSAALAYGLGALFFVRLPRTAPQGSVHGFGSGEMVRGFRYVLNNRTVLIILGLAAGRNILLAPSHAFLPVFASNTFSMGAIGLGVFTASLAGGRLGGSVLVAFLGDNPHKIRLLLGAGMASGILVLLFAQSRSFWLATFFLFLSGVAHMVCLVAESTILQAITARNMRGRVAGFLRITAGLTPLALLPGGLLVDRWGAAPAVSLFGVAGTLLFVVAALTWPRAWNLRG